MTQEESLAPVIERIYEAMLDLEQWPRALNAVAQAVGGRLPMLHHHDTREHAGRFLLHAGYDAQTVEAYRDYYSARNIWLRNGGRLLGTRMVRSSQMMSSRRELLRSEWYNDFLRPLGLSHAVGGTLIKHGDGAFSCISVFAGSDREEFDEEDLRVLEALLPHLRRALQVHMRLLECRDREQTWLETVEKAPAGVLLVTEDWKVQYANPAARSFFAAEGGLALDGGGISAAVSDDTARLRLLIGRAARTSARDALHAGGVVRIRRPNGLPPLEILISPLAPKDVPPVGERAVAALYLREMRPTVWNPVAALSSRYGLTPGETRVLAALASGVSGKRAAQALGISYNTLKTHLQHLFMKTGARRQLELVHLVHRDAAETQATSPRLARITQSGDDWS